MSNPVSNQELDGLIWHALRDRSQHPTNCKDLIAAAGGLRLVGRIDRRMQVMRNAGRIRLYRGPAEYRPAHFRAHGWEVLGCPGDGSSEDGQWHWREGCEDCQRRTKPDSADGVIELPPIIAFECHLRIEPST